MRNGELAEIRETDDGKFLCPICDAEVPQTPYDLKTGKPSREWCPNCDHQWGWDDIIPPDSPPGTIARKWRELREQWERNGGGGSPRTYSQAD
jgi:hypothetical protein